MSIPDTAIAQQIRVWVDEGDAVSTDEIVGRVAQRAHRRQRRARMVVATGMVVLLGALSLVIAARGEDRPGEVNTGGPSTTLHPGILPMTETLDLGGQGVLEPGRVETEITYAELLTDPPGWIDPAGEPPVVLSGFFSGGPRSFDHESQEIGSAFYDRAPSIVVMQWERVAQGRLQQTVGVVVLDEQGRIRIAMSLPALDLRDGTGETWTRDRLPAPLPAGEDMPEPEPELSAEAVAGHLGLDQYLLTPLPPETTVVPESEAIEIALAEHPGGRRDTAIVLLGELMDGRYAPSGTPPPGAALHDGGPTYVVTVDGYSVAARGRPGVDEPEPPNRTWTTFIDAETGEPLFSTTYL